jgi:hypothetical protein
MALLFNIGNILADQSEIAEKVHLGDFNHFVNQLAKGENGTLKFRAGTVTGSDLMDNSSLSLPQFTQPKIGGPLSVEILSIYMGDAPRKFFGGRTDLLVVSGVKSLVTHGAAPRAINQLVEKVDDFQYLQPGAFTQGSPIVFYTPAIDITTTFCSFELITDSFNKDVFETIARLFTSAAGLPIFAPASGYLLVGSTLLRMMGNLGNALFDTPPFLREDIAFRFDTPDLPIAKAKQLVICNEKDKEQFLAYMPAVVDSGSGNRRPVLINKVSGKEYRGNAPYILVSIDGRERKELQEFAPKLASAAIIEKFYGTTPEFKPIDVLEKAIMLYNDYTYYQKANELAKSLNTASENENPRSSEDLRKATDLYNAYVKNISNELFKSSVLETGISQ